MGLLVLYGSATGKAESIAELLAAEAEKKGLRFEVKCMSEVGGSLDSFLAGRTLVAVSSTTGDGEQPETAARLFRMLRRDSRPDLSGLRFAYLGLGDTNYTQFCNGPKTMRAALLDCGAQEFYPPGWADDGTGFVCKCIHHILLHFLRKINLNGSSRLVRNVKILIDPKFSGLRPL